MTRGEVERCHGVPGDETSLGPQDTERLCCCHRAFGMATCAFGRQRGLFCISKKSYTFQAGVCWFAPKD